MRRQLNLTAAMSGGIAESAASPSFARPRRGGNTRVRAPTATRTHTEHTRCAALPSAPARRSTSMITTASISSLPLPMGTSTRLEAPAMAQRRSAGWVCTRPKPGRNASPAEALYTAEVHLLKSGAPRARAACIAEQAPLSNCVSRLGATNCPLSAIDCDPNVNTSTVVRQ